MNRTLLVVSLAVILTGSAAIAQPALTSEQQRLRREPNATHEACVAELDANGVAGTARRAAFEACYQQRRRDCIAQAASEGLPVGDESRDFVRDCIARGP